MSLNLLRKSLHKITFSFSLFSHPSPQLSSVTYASKDFLSYSMHAVSSEAFGEEAVLEAF